MYCKKCGNSVDNTNNYCSNCGTKIGEEGPNKNNHHSQPIILAIGIISGLSIFGIILLSTFAIIVTAGFDKAKDELRNGYDYEYNSSSNIVHSREEMLEYLDQLDCSNYNSDEMSITDDLRNSCNLKDKYKVIDETLTYDYYNKDIRTLYIKMNDYDLQFEVSSQIECISFLDSTCLYSDYVLSTNYQLEASLYFRKQFYSSKKSNLITSKDNYQTFNIKDKSSINEASELLIGYIDFINNLDFKYAYPEDVIEINFDEKNKLMLKVLLNDGRYIVTDYHNYVIDDLEEFFLEFINVKKIYD